MNRRDFLGLTVPAAAAVLASERVLWAQGGKPAPQAKEGEIRITDVKTYAPGPLFVQITTDAGIDGWGEVNLGPASISAVIAETYKPLLIGVNPTRIEHIWQMLFRAHRNVRGGLLHTSVLGGIDIALWDILGKVAKLPIYTLLGGPARDRILFYPNARAVKVTSHTLHPMVETPGNLDSIVAALEEARKKVGPGGYLMYDGHGKFSATVAIQLCKRIEHLGLLYFEEVVPPENNEDLVRVKRATTVPLAAGERMAGIWPFRRLFELQAADVLNPDIVHMGGISQLRKLAAIAEVYDIPIAPHGNHSAIGLAASLHMDASVNNFLIQEAYGQNVSVRPWLTGITWPQDESFPLPPGPGLGIQVNMDGLTEAVAKAGEDKGISTAYFLNDGSVADR